TPGPVAESQPEIRAGDGLRRYGGAAGLAQEALAEGAAMSARGISALERAARKHPYPATVRRLAEALGLSDADRRGLEAAVASSARLDVETATHTSASARIVPTPPSR